MGCFGNDKEKGDVEETHKWTYLVCYAHLLSIVTPENVC